MICNMDTCTEMAMLVDHQKKYLAPFCGFRHGTPSHDTFGKVLSRLDWRAIAGVAWLHNPRNVNEKTTAEGHYFIYSLKEAQAQALRTWHPCGSEGSGSGAYGLACFVSDCAVRS